MEFNDTQVEALREIVTDWISEGFTTPPYKDAYYDIFEKLRITNEKRPSGGYELPVSYDVRRP
jgi:hypothetical protein